RRGPRGRDPIVACEDGTAPEHGALAPDSVGPALLVVLETLAPAERLAFVLHDMFAVPFAEIAPIVDRPPTAARQLASRARRRVHGAGQRQREGERAGASPGEGVERPREAELDRRRTVVDAFLAAARGGDFQGLLAVLDPDVVFRSDAAVRLAGGVVGEPGAAGGAPPPARGRAPGGEPAPGVRGRR